MGRDFRWWRRTISPHDAAGGSVREGGGAGPGEGALALGVAFGGTLVLGHLVGAESEWELLLLLAAVAGVGFVFETVRLQEAVKRPPERSDRRLD